ncbi:MAG: nucleotide-binding protein [Campylobacter sp.]|nr:nucleotide-binding protein [Campylobacter sp.]
MTQEEIKKILSKKFKFEKGGNNSYVTKHDGCTITIHTNGKLQVQGKNTEQVNKIINDMLKTQQTIEEKQLFIVYGHDKNAKEQLEHSLAKLEVATKQVTNDTGMTIIEALEQAISTIHAGIILLTPDDICIPEADYNKHRDSLDGYIHKRARQNVILEMGMVMARLGRDNTIILHKEGVELPSDIEGVFRIDFKEHIKETIPTLIKRLEHCGFELDKDKILKTI